MSLANPFFSLKKSDLTTASYNIVVQSLSRVQLSHGLYPTRLPCLWDFLGKNTGKLEWVAMSFSGGSSRPSDQTCISCIGKQVFYH